MGPVIVQQSASNVFHFHCHTVHAQLGHCQANDEGGGGGCGRGGGGEVKEQNSAFELQVDNLLHSQRPENKPILFVSDSTMRTLIPEMLTNAFGGSLTHGIEAATNPTTDGGHELRCYTSSENWIGAKFPKGAALVRVPNLLKQKFYRVLIIQESLCDISNLANLHPSLQIFLAEVSAANTLKVAEDAIRNHNQLEIVFILGRSPRIDSTQLQRISNHGSAYMERIVEESTLAAKIAHCPLKFLDVTTESQARVLFGIGGDGVHMSRSHAARHLYTSAVIRAVLNSIH